ncbi:MAG TPA: MBL fold metallo-hydrolase [Thermoanaerobaculia bacterium]|jgi:glyoxylase-like metal-dependent hydrolase (beta-lactamase superfamily II)|nr:MBL fold metallo-hydrolase [Thermoanaerobaculia bacterium]
MMRIAIAALSLSLSCTASTPESPASLLHIATFTSNEAAGLANAHLIAGKRDAILVDAVQTRSEAMRLADWIERSKKQLTMIFITHPHGDHLLGLDVLAQRFPGIRIVATPQVSAEIARREAGMLSVAQRRWSTNGPQRLIVPEPLDGDTIYVEGVPLKIINANGAECAFAAMLYEPRSRMLFASDLVASGVHLNTREANIERWQTQLDALAKMDVARFYPGHGPAGGVELIPATRRYLEDFRAALKGAMPEEVLRRMRAKYPRHRLEENLERGVAGRFPG